MTRLRPCLLALSLCWRWPRPRRAAEKLPPGAKLVGLEAQPGADRAEAPLRLSPAPAHRHARPTASVSTSRAWSQCEAPATLVKVSADRPGPARGRRRRASSSSRSAARSVDVPVKVSGQKDEVRGQLRPRRDAGHVASWAATPAPATARPRRQERLQALAARLRSALRPPALTDDLAGRRFNRAAPDHSLMLLKPAGGVPHVGGVLTQPGEPYYELLRPWIAEGVKLDLDSAARQPASRSSRRTRSCRCPA